MKKYKVYLIGAGPGDPELITVKGCKILRQADVVIYDYLVNINILNQLPPKVETVCADSLDKRRFKDGFAYRQDLINELILKKVSEGKRVVRLKNGDPFIFARANEELAYLIKHKIKFCIIPGVSAGTAAACYSGIPLTSRDCSSSVVFVTGHEAVNKPGNPVDWRKIAGIDTIVVYMGAENIPQIARVLIEVGKIKSTSVAVISHVSQINQNIYFTTLQKLTKSKIPDIFRTPAIIIIGPVVNLAKKFNWWGKTKKVLYTGLSEERFFTDAWFSHLPLITIRSLTDYRDIDKQINRLADFNWLVFLSRFGVYHFFTRLLNLGYDIRKLSHLRIAAIGTSTATVLKKYGLIADLVPKHECSDGLITEFKQRDMQNQKVLVLKSDIGDKNVSRQLTQLGAQVFPLTVYHNVIPDDLPDIEWQGINEIMFSSPSTVRNFFHRYHKIPQGIKVKTIGSVTKQELNKNICI